MDIIFLAIDNLIFHLLHDGGKLLSYSRNYVHALCYPVQIVANPGNISET